jgi:hypothetical protein
LFKTRKFLKDLVRVIKQKHDLLLRQKPGKPQASPNYALMAPALAHHKKYTKTLTVPARLAGNGP